MSEHLPTLSRPPAMVEPYTPADEPPLDVRRWRQAVWRYRWWIAALAALGTLAGVAASRVLPPRYLAQATIWIQTESQSEVNRGPIGVDRLLPAPASVDLLKSYVVLDEVVRSQRLYLRAPGSGRAALRALTVGEQFRAGEYRLRVDAAGGTYRLENDAGVTLERGTVGDSVGRPLGIRWAPPPSVLPPGGDIKFTLTSVRDAAKSLADALRVTIDQSGNFLRVSLVAPDGGVAAVIVNAVIQRYVTVANELKRGKLTEMARLLDDQLATARENLQRAENALAAFRKRTITLDPLGPAGGRSAGPWRPGGGTGAAAGDAPAAAPGGRGADYFALRLEAEELRRDHAAIERALAQGAAGGDTVGWNGLVEALSFIGAVQRSADLQAALKEATTKRADLRALRYRYTDAHADVRRAADQVNELERRAIPALARTLQSQLDARIRALAPEIAAGGEQLQQMPQRAVEEARLRRDADIAAGLYTVVLQRQAEARLAEASSIADVRILDAAVAPLAPLKNTTRRLIAFGFVLGLGLGLVGAVVADRMDPRVRYRDQITRQMGLNILGVLPHVKDRTRPDDEQMRQLVEAARTVRLSLGHAYGPRRPLLVTITSPGIGDGKSFVAANLAQSCAQARQRTLLVDGDTRRGTLDKGYAVPRKPGLTDHLAGRVPLEAVLRPTPHPGLDFISAGSRLRGAPELLGSPAMAQLIERVKPAYDVVIIDSPPLGAGIDPFTLGTLTGHVLLVLRTGATNLELTRTGLEMLVHLPIRLVGAVLNDVRPGNMYGYYYSYLAVDEEAEDAAPVAALARESCCAPATNGGRDRLDSERPET